MVDAGRQRDLAAQVGGLDLEPGELVVLGPARCSRGRRRSGRARRSRSAPSGCGSTARAPRPCAAPAPSFGTDQRPFLVVLDRAHEGVGDQEAVVQVQRLAVRIAAGRAADLDELLDLGMADRQVDRRRAAPQRALGDRQGQAVHHADEGNDAGGLAVLPDLLADRAQVAPVGADAAAPRGQPDILVPQADDALQRLSGLVQEAGDRQAAVGAAVATAPASPA